MDIMPIILGAGFVSGFYLTCKMMSNQKRLQNIKDGINIKENHIFSSHITQSKKCIVSADKYGPNLHDKTKNYFNFNDDLCGIPVNNRNFYQPNKDSPYYKYIKNDPFTMSKKKAENKHF